MIWIATASLLALAQEPAKPDPAQTPPAPPPAAREAPKPADLPAPSEGEPPARSEIGEWKELDRVVIVVNEDALARGSMQRAFARLTSDRNLRTPEDRERAWGEFVTNMIRAKVMKQSGEALGFAPETIDRFARDDFDRTRRRYGTAASLSQALEKDGLTAEQLKQMRRDTIYSELWEDAITGRGASVAARPSRDRYVRPGLLRFEYQNAIDDPIQLPAMGGEEDELALQRLLVEVKGFDSAARAKEFAGEMKKRIAAGEDMSALVQKYSALKNDDGMLKPGRVSSACRVYAGAAPFLLHARAGEVSEPFLVEGQGVQGFVLLRVVDRKAGHVPELSAPETQQKIASNLQRTYDNFRVETALQKALDESFTWPPQGPRRR